jgi:Zn-dependent metalloprotease
MNTLKLSNTFTCPAMVILFMLTLSFSIAAQQIDSKLSSLPFRNATITMDQQGRAATEIKLQPGSYIPVEKFFESYFQAFNFSKENEARSYQIFSDKIGQTHHRLRQYYKGIELAEVQYRLHEKDGLVFLAHGNFVPGLKLDITPSLTESEALQCALNYIKAEAYVWENPKNEILLKREQNDPEATYYPKGELKISAGRKAKIAENFRLVYRFDIFAAMPLSRNYVDVDAKTGEVLYTLSRINYGDVLGQGLSLYNGTVPITVSDTDFPTWPQPSHWHLTGWNTYGGSGQSWWLADPTLGNQGGYADLWYEALDTDSIMVSGTNPTLTFYHRYFIEAPGSYKVFDGYDGMNVRISADNGKTWQILTNPTPAYSCSSLWSFGGIHGEGPGIPGWAGELNNWSKVTFDLSSYSGQTIQLRFAFAADGGLSTVSAPELFSWQIDEVLVASSEGVLFYNNGDPAGMTSKNIYKEVTLIAGKYRLREIGRGSGISTYDCQSGDVFSQAVDFVDEDSLFVDIQDRPGVSVHWALEGVYDYYWIKHRRKSYDNADGRLIAYTNYIFTYPDGTTSPNNAMWIGSCSLYGSGDGTYWGPWGTLDIVGHEITHGVTQESADLIYEYEPGALNESFSDIFGTALEFYVKGSAGDWLIAKDNNKFGSSGRSLANPNLQEDPDTYLGQYWVKPVEIPAWENDYSGVHTNCGVHNYWFYLLCEGGSSVNDNGDSYTVTDIGLADAEQIAYRNLTVYLTPSSQYYDAAHYSRQAAIDLFGENSNQHRSVVDAWLAVGIYLEPMFRVDADTLHFLTEVQQPETLQVSLTNKGLDSLKIDQITFPDEYFHLIDTLSLPLILAKDEHRVLKIVFLPSDQEARIFDMIFMSNDPYQPVRTVVLKGNVFHRAESNTIYAIAEESNRSFLLTIDAADSAKAGNLRALNAIGINGFAIHKSSAYLYGVVSNVLSSKFIKIDPQTGLSREVCNISRLYIQAMAFDGDTLLGIGYNYHNLYKIHLPSGKAIVSGVTEVPYLSSLAINPANPDELWAVSVYYGKIYIFNRQGSKIWERKCGLKAHAIAFDSKGELFALYYSQNSMKTELAILDRDTSKTEAEVNDILIGSTGYKFVTALAINGDIKTAISDESETVPPDHFALYQNYPNPFNPSTTIEFALPKPAFVTLKVYNLLGEQVATLVSEQRSAGIHKLNWDARGLASGVYLYRLEAGEFMQTKKSILMR